jgi:hypothetical protein
MATTIQPVCRPVMSIARLRVQPGGRSLYSLIRGLALSSFCVGDFYNCRHGSAGIDDPDSWIIDVRFEFSYDVGDPERLYFGPVTFSQVPEPPALMLLGLGLVAGAGRVLRHAPAFGRRRG